MLGCGEIMGGVELYIIYYHSYVENVLKYIILEMIFGWLCFWERYVYGDKCWEDITLELIFGLLCLWERCVYGDKYEGTLIYFI